MLLDEYPLLTVSPESSSYPVCITVAAYSSSSTGAPPERTFFEYLCFFLCLQANFFLELCLGEVLRIYYQEDKRCMLMFLKLGADFSLGGVHTQTHDR